MDKKNLKKEQKHMDNATFDRREVSLHSACDIDTAILIDFYKAAYPTRAKRLASYWKWLNRTDLCGDKIPLVLIYKNQVIARAEQSGERRLGH